MVRALPAWGDRYLLRLIRVAIGVVIALQVVVSVPNGIAAERGAHAYQVESVVVLRHIDRYSNRIVVKRLYVFSTASFLRSRAQFLEQHHLNIFSGSGSGA